jgi:hypothetical protein
VLRYRQLKDRLSALRPLTGLELVRGLWAPDDQKADDVRESAERLAIENPQPKLLYAALLREITQPDLPGSNSDIIRVMSLHKSKGLTAALVVIAGCVSGALPTIDKDIPSAIQDFQREEQRRLFYVAITRATDTLVISSSVSMLSRDALSNGIDVQRHFRGSNQSMMAATSASPFIAELGPAAPRPISSEQWRIQASFYSTLAIQEATLCRLGKGGQAPSGNWVKSGGKVDITKLLSLPGPCH